MEGCSGGGGERNVPERELWVVCERRRIPTYTSESGTALIVTQCGIAKVYGLSIPWHGVGT